MKSLLSLLLAFLILTGCNSSYDNTTTESQPAFSVSLSPAFAPSTDPVVPVNAQLLLHASKALNPLTVNESTVYVQNGFDELQPAYITLIGQDIVVQPKVYLPAQEQLYVIVSTLVQTTDGAHLSAKATIPFLSGLPTGDTTSPLYLGSNVKSGGSTHPNSTLYFQFDEAISPLIPNNIITVTHPITKESISGTVTVSDTLLYFRPSTPLKDFNELGTDVGYDINLSLTNNITDLSGNPFVGSDQSINVIGQSNAAAITQVSLINTNNYTAFSPIYVLETVGSTLFSGGENGLHIVSYDIVNSSFSSLSTLSTPTMGTVYAISVDSLTKRVYLGTSTGVSIVDITNLNVPVLLAHYPTVSPVYGLDFQTDHLYLAATTEGVIDINISDATNPRFIQQYNTAGTAFDVMFTVTSTYGNFVNIADYNNGMTLLDEAFNFPTNASFSGFYGQVRSLMQDENSSTQYIALSSIGGFYTFDLESTPPPGMISKSAFPSYATKAISNTNLTAYINLKDIGIGLLDYSIPVTAALFTNYFSAPFEISTFAKVAVDGHEHLILVDANGNFHAIKIV